MLDKFLRNKKAIVAISREMGIEFTVMEWENITNFCTILAPINDAILELQKRTTTISSVIPIYRWLMKTLHKQCDDFIVNEIRSEIAKKLEELMLGWDRNKSEI